MSMEICDIVAVQGTGVLAWLIRFGTRSQWTHVALHVGDGQVAEIGPEFPARVVPLLYERYAIFRYRPGLTTAQQATIIAWLRGQMGSWYDWSAVASIVLRRLFGGLGACVNSRHRYICTELVIEGYLAAGIELVHTCEPVTPAELMLLPALQPVDSEVA